MQILVFLCVVLNFVEAEIRKALQREFTWVASVQVRYMEHNSGGTVISIDYVLTDCGTIIENGFVTLYIMAGSTELVPSNNATWTGQRRMSSKVHVHKKCKEMKNGILVTNFYGLEENLAIIKVTEPFSLNDHLQPMKPSHFINAPRASRLEEMIGKHCDIASWGYVLRTPLLPVIPNNNLMVVSIIMLDYEVCKRALCTYYEGSSCQGAHYDLMARGEYCALHPTVIVKENAEFLGDLGGSLTCSGEFYGLVSWRPLKKRKLRWKRKSQYTPAGPEVPTMFESIADNWIWLMKNAPDMPNAPSVIPYTPEPTGQPPPSQAIPSLVPSLFPSVIIFLATTKSLGPWLPACD